ncbi:hypothetical protein NWF32_26000 [Pseudomonas qingdaonensis]|nr:hypothetical protein [Pseudomonas qingdaonensis]
MDRFLMKVLLDYPAPADEGQVLQLLRQEEQRAAAKAASDSFSLGQEVIFQARREVAAIHVAPAIDSYLIALVNATRHPADYDADLARWLQLGASPRGGIGLDRCARAMPGCKARTSSRPTTCAPCSTRCCAIACN